MNRILFFIFLLSVQSVFTAHSADSQGLYSIHGAGLLDCKVFVEERAKKSPAYMMIGGWLDGYITAANKLENNTYDIMAFSSTELLTVLIDRHCSDHPNDLLAPVLDAMLTELHKDRIRAASPLVVVRVGEYQTRLYAKTVSEIQSKLALKKFFKTDPTGEWSDSTRVAIADYQKTADLEATGFPDQKTLWHLFRSKP